MARLGSRRRHRAPAEVRPDSELAAPHEYLVQDGDTLSSIAKAHRVATASLLAMNGLSWSSGIATGQRILVPSSETTNTLSLPTGRLEVTRHRIAIGETVSAIAAQYGVTRLAILRANGLHQTSLIFVDQVLIIPAVSVDTRAPAAQQSLAG